MNCKHTIVFFLFLLFPVFLRAQTEGNPGKDFKDYEFIQFITSSGSSPQNIIKLDNNAGIIMYCTPGRSTEEMGSEGIAFTESQLKLMEAWRLLEKEGEVYKTAFPILGKAKTGELREQTKTTGEKLGVLLEGDIEELKEELKSIGREDNIYSILFSYVIDGLVWDDFENSGFVNVREITAEHPFWDGVIWALYPKRGFICGTNTISDKGVQMSVNWSANAIKNMIPFVSDWKNLSVMFDEYIEQGKVVNREAKSVFAPYGLFDESGFFTIPVIEEVEGNRLYGKCLAIAKKISGNVIEYMDVNSMTGEFGFKDDKETLVIAYHEVMWDLLDYLESRGVVEKPVVFSSPDSSSPEDVSSLIFFVKRVK